MREEQWPERGNGETGSAFGSFGTIVSEGEKSRMEGNRLK